jgi:hypothetical protein
MFIEWASRDIQIAPLSWPYAEDWHVFFGRAVSTLVGNSAIRLNLQAKRCKSEGHDLEDHTARKADSQKQYRPDCVSPGRDSFLLLAASKLAVALFGMPRP